MYEKFFRDKVTDFLYDGKIKLFRSPTEGNMLVRLMDISLSPNQQLGRLVYSFSATVYEIDKPTFENYLKYGIQKTGEYQTYVHYTHDVLSQINNKSWSSNVNIFDEITKKHISQATSGFENKVNYISYLKFT